MKETKFFDVIIIGGSYSGLAAGMALGRSLKQVLIIDSGKPCNRQTPYSHNFITQDGKTPLEIRTLAKQQVQQYPTVQFFDGLVTHGVKTQNGFDICVATGERFSAKKIIFATGIKDLMPEINGFAECWGISVLHCPYCHGYEVRNKTTGILGNGEYGYEFSILISNWTKELTLYTNGKSTLTTEQTAKLKSHSIKINEAPVEKLEHTNGYIQQIVFIDGTRTNVKALYARNAFEQHSTLPESLGCKLTEEGYIKVDPMQKTTIDGIYACGDNTTRMRSVSVAIAMGATAGMMLNKELVLEEFEN